MSQDLYELPEGWAHKTIGQITTLITKGSTPTSYGYKFQSSGINFLKIENIVDGEVTSQSITSFISEDAHEYLKRSQLKENDLLFSIAGSIGTSAIVGSAILPANTNQALALIRGYEEYATPSFLLYSLRSEVLNETKSKSRGGALQNISLTDIKNTNIPLPPLNEQKRIVAKLDALFTRIDTAITHLQQTLELSKALFASALDEAFLPENNNGKSVPLNQVATVARGKSKHRPRNDKTLFGGNYPFIQTGDVRNAKKCITAYSTTYNEKGLSQSKLWPEGTICLTIAANIGEVAILGMDACFPDSVVGISSESGSNEYIYYFLTTLKRLLDSKATMAAQKNINLRVLSELEIPIPPLDEQKHIVTHLDALSERIAILESSTQEKLNDLKNLKASLLDAAFKGQL